MPSPKNPLSVHWKELYFILLRDFCAAPKAQLVLFVSCTSYCIPRGAPFHLFLSLPSLALQCWSPTTVPQLELRFWNREISSEKGIIAEWDLFYIEVVPPHFPDFLSQVCYATVFDYLVWLFWYHLIQLCMASFTKVHQIIHHMCHHSLFFTVFSLNLHWLLKLRHFLPPHLDHVIVSNVLLPHGHLQFNPLPSITTSWVWWCLCLYYWHQNIISNCKYSSTQNKTLKQFSGCFEVICILFLFYCGSSNETMSMH